MNNDSVWILSADKKESSKPILDYIIQQADDLLEKTGGKLKAALEATGIPLAQFAKRLSDLTPRVGRSNNHAKARDASTFYERHTYEFFIVDESHNYELSVFQITCNDQVPVLVVIDDDIAEDADMDKEQYVDSLEEFKGLFRDIVTSDKVVYIIDKLLHLPDPEPKSESTPFNEDKE